jgi:putative nucleotidyltransferase with HDIG domain
MERLRHRLEQLPSRVLYVGLTLITFFALSALIAVDFRPLVSLGLAEGAQAYEPGDVAAEDVYAPRSVTYEDPVATELARNEAASQVPPIYVQDDGVPGRVNERVERFFDQVREIREGEAPAEEKVSRVVGTAPFYLPDEIARSIVFLEDDDLADAERYVAENLEELYAASAVADDSLTDSPATVISLSEGRARLSDAARIDASGEVGSVVESLSRGFLEPNYVVDRAATTEARESTAASVEPVTGTILQGERVIARGEVVDEEDIAKLEALGLVRSSNPWTVFLGVGLVVATELGIAWYLFDRFGARLFRTNMHTKLVLAALLTVIFTALAQIFTLAELNPYLTPLAGLGILGTILLGPRIAFLMVVITSVNAGIIADNDFYLTAALLLSSGFAIYTVVRARSRSELLRAGLIVAGVMAGISFATSLIGGAELSVAAFQGLWGLGNGLLSLALAMVLLPVLENAFNIMTPMRLLELSDPSNPLLQKLLREAPGTFSHAMQVGNLAESAAERIGADTLLARVGAYYHDVGKMEHPHYFIENQIARSNPHQSLSPALSVRVIQRHVKDGLDIGRAWNLPQEVLDIIAQHHGTTRVEYFYRKALDEAPVGAHISEADFRHVGGRPKSKEAGILMLADSIEAAVKAMDKPTPKRIQDVVDGVIRQKLEDGQFDECELTIREIHEAGEAIRDALIGFLGPRITYPESTTKDDKQKKIPAKNPSTG